MTESRLILESPKKILGIQEEPQPEANKIIWAVFGSNSRVGDILPALIAKSNIAWASIIANEFCSPNTLR